MLERTGMVCTAELKDLARKFLKDGPTKNLILSTPDYIPEEEGATLAKVLSRLLWQELRPEKL